MSKNLSLTFLLMIDGESGELLALLEVIHAPDGTKVYPSFCNGLNGRQGLIPGTTDLDKELRSASDGKKFFLSHLIFFKLKFWL